MILHHRLGKILGIANLILTFLCVLIIGFAIFGGRPVWGRSAGAGDYILFILLWSYVFVTPIAAGLALFLGDRHTLAVRANYAVLVLWLVVIVWMASMTLRLAAGFQLIQIASVEW